MLLNEIKTITPKINAKMIVEQIDAEIMLELWGGVSALGGAVRNKVGAAASEVGNRVKQAGQAVANTYNQGEIQSLVKQYDAYKQKLLALIQKYPHAFGQQAQQAQQTQQAPAQPTGNSDPQGPARNGAWGGGAFARESVQMEQEILNELLGGLGALFGAAKGKAVDMGNRAKAAATDMGQRVGGVYVKGEANAILNKMVEIAKALQAKGYKVTPAQAQEYSRLRKMVGV